MKDYKKVADKIRKMGTFCNIHNLGTPTEYCPVNLCLQLCEAYIIGYTFYVSYDWGKWNIDYSLNPAIKKRTDMKHIRGIKTDRDMYAKVEEIINEIRKYCGVNKNKERINMKKLNWIVRRNNNIVEYLKGEKEAVESYVKELQAADLDSEYSAEGFEYEFNETIKFKTV